MIYDCFPFNEELDLLECRIRELESVSDLVHVVVEADVTHQDRPKPYYYAENASRFAEWDERIINIRASNLPTLAENPDPWAREHAQREWIGVALEHADPTDIVLQSDVDEIPTAVVARNVKPNGMIALEQRLYSMAVDWMHPDPWRGTVAATVAALSKLGNKPFGYMRDCRNIAPVIRSAGWHFSWLGGKEAQLRKLDAFCHPEIADRTRDGLEEDLFYTLGYHVDGKKLIAVDVDETWPKWIREGNAPANWYRPR